MVARKVSPTMRAASNMECTALRSSDLPLPKALRSSDITAWVVARLPADRMAMTRLPGRVKRSNLRTRATWSTPALERESEASTKPCGNNIPRQ